MEVLPNELLEAIAEFCPLRDSKQMALTSRRFYSAFKERIWRHPAFRKNSVTIDVLRELSHLPIQTMHSRFFNEDLSVSWWRHWNCFMKLCPLLTTFHIDAHGRAIRIEQLKNVLSGLAVSVVLHTKALFRPEVIEFEKLHDALSCICLEGLAIDHLGVNAVNEGFAWTLPQLEQFRRYPLIKIAARSLRITKMDIPRLINLLSDKKPCAFSMDYLSRDEFGERGYEFNVDDINSFVKNEIRVPRLTTCSLLHEGDELGNFVPLLENLRGLKDVKIHEHDEIYLSSSTIELFSDLPVRFLSTVDLDMDARKAEESARLMCTLKSLEKIEIYGYHNYKLTLEDFKLFHHLPVWRLNLGALNEEDLKNHLLEFRKLMMEMKILNVRSQVSSVQVYDHCGEGGPFQTV